MRSFILSLLFLAFVSSTNAGPSSHRMNCMSIAKKYSAYCSLDQWGWKCKQARSDYRYCRELQEQRSERRRGMEREELDRRHDKWMKTGGRNVFDDLSDWLNDIF